MGTHFLHRYGNPDIHERLLKPAIQGEKIGTICITEPDAGSDLSAIKTSAKKVEGGYQLNGQKAWVTSASTALRLTSASPTISMASPILLRRSVGSSRPE